MVGNDHAGCPALPPGRFQASNNIITMGKAKRGGVFGMIRGSVGPATYSIGKDGAGKKQQIIREKPIEVANPRTRAQAIQRMKMVPVQYALSLLGDIVDHSFRGIQEGWPSRRHFMSLAMRELDIPFIKKGSLDRAIGGYQISAGTLGDTRAVLVNCQNISSRFYERSVPSSSFVLDTMDDTMGLTWADVSRNILATNPALQDGDEIAVIAFIVNNTAANKGVKVVKRRMLIDTSFTAETPEEFVFTFGEGQSATTYDCNVLYAASIYNEIDSSTLAALTSESFLLTMPPARPGSGLFNAFMGFEFNAGEPYQYFVKPVTAASDISNGSIKVALVPEVVSEVVNGALAAIAFVVSRREGEGWNYSVSDICLTKGYLSTVNTAELMEAAIASYMTESGIDTTSSEYYLQLTQEQAENYGIASVNVNGTLSIEGTDTNVIATVNGRINPISGKNILFVNADGYIISDGSGADVALAYGGFRWKNASTGAYITPSNYVKAADIADTSNIEFANLVD